MDENDEGSTLHWRADNLDTDLLFPGLFAESEEAWLGLEHLDQISRQMAMNKLDALSPEIREALARMHSPLSGRGWPNTRLHPLYSIWKYGRITDDSGVVYSVGASQVRTNTSEASGPQKYTGSRPARLDRTTVCSGAL